MSSKNSYSAFARLGASLRSARGPFLVSIGAGLVITAALYGWYKSVQHAIHATMPADGKALFARVDSARCSSNDCGACNEDACRKVGPPCEVKVYRWKTRDRGYLRAYCGAAEIAELPK